MVDILNGMKPVLNSEFFPIAIFPLMRSVDCGFSAGTVPLSEQTDGKK